MEKILGLRFGGSDFGYNEQNIKICSAVSQNMLQYLIDNYPVTFNQILYPYADMLSLSCKNGSESTQIFGTHLILRGVEEEFVAEVLFHGLQSAAEHEWQPDVIVHHFGTVDGCAAAEEIAAFLQCDCTVLTVGDFAQMLGGFVPHWRIREAAKAFASFSEMSYRVSKGAICGLAGGRLALREDIEPIVTEKLRSICYQKTCV